MSIEDLVRGRRMVRAFTEEPVDAADVDDICDLARRAPSAGNASGVSFLVLRGDDTSAYWDVTLPAARRAAFAWPGLLKAPVLTVIWVDVSAYLRRYSEPDKQRTRLGTGAEAWPVPYWFVDGGAAMMTMLLAARERGLGAAFFGLFDNEQAVRERFGVPSSCRAVGTVALGHAGPDRPSRSAHRARRPLPRGAPSRSMAQMSRHRARDASGSRLRSSAVSVVRVPLVGYLRLEPEPHLVAHECKECAARYFDRRNACARCGKDRFCDVEVDSRGEVTAFTIVHRAAPGIPVPFVAATVRCDDGTWVRANVVNCDPTPEAVTLGMRVRLRCFSVGIDDDGTEAVAFGYEPA